MQTDCGKLLTHSLTAPPVLGQTNTPLQSAGAGCENLLWDGNLDGDGLDASVADDLEAVVVTARQEVVM